MLANEFELIALKESRSDIVFLQHRDIWLVKQLPPFTARE